MLRRTFVTLILLGTGLAHAQTYRWTDDKGQVHFGDIPPPATASKSSKPSAIAPREAASAEPAPQPVPFEVQRAQKDFPVTLYTAPICKEPCELARATLNRRGIPFSEVQVWNQETLNQLKAKAGSDNVPAIVVGRTAISGFNAAQYDALLDSAGYPKEGTVPARSQHAPAVPEGYAPPPAAEPAVPETPAGKAGPYDSSNLPSSGGIKPGPYDASGLKGTTLPKSGPYVTPGAEK